jgi:hypothetical protein
MNISSLAAYPLFTLASTAKINFHLFFAFAKLRKATVRLVFSHCWSFRPYVRPQETTPLPLDRFSIISVFSKGCRENQIFIKFGYE